MGTHVVAWEMANGPVPDGTIVCHTCDVKRCVRNDESGIHVVNGIEFPRVGHLFLATNAVNSADMVAKRRQARGDSHGSRLHPESLITGDDHWTRQNPERLTRGDEHWMRQNGALFSGDANPHAKLSWGDVREIRRRFAEHPYHGFTTHVASEFNVTPAAIYAIIHNKSWRE